MQQASTFLQAEGFGSGDHKRDFGDLSLVKTVDYLRKVDNGVYIYVMVISYEGKVVEIFAEKYAAEKNTMRVKGSMKIEEARKKGYAATSYKIIRSMNELVDFLANG